MIKGDVMLKEWIRTVIILPMNVVVFIPCLILYFSGYEWMPDYPLIVAGVILFVLGLVFAGWTMRLFAVKGQGTAAPWNPPKKLVISGPYRHVRNPMISSVLAMLAGEVLISGSWGIFAWFVLFIIVNAIYFPLFEEKSLEKRFGGDYIEYKRNVPRWLPRLRPWKGGD